MTHVLVQLLVPFLLLQGKVRCYGGLSLHKIKDELLSIGREIIFESVFGCLLICSDGWPVVLHVHKLHLHELFLQVARILTLPQLSLSLFKPLLEQLVL